MFYRIRTRVDAHLSVLTLFFPQTWKWITIRSVTTDGKVTTSSTDAPDEYGAGINHLQACKR